MPTPCLLLANLCVCVSDDGTNLCGSQNPNSYVVERAKHRMGLPLNEACTWDHLCHIWKDALQLEKDSRVMLEKAFPVRLHMPCMTTSGL
jgi:hypothetical protein